MATLELGGTSFEYTEDGSGDPLVLVHGSASDLRTWGGQRTVLAETCRVFSYSRRYHWPNDPIPEGVDYRMDQQVEDLGAFIETLNLSHVHLVGHSYGGFLCLLLAMRKPQLVRSMVLAEPPVLTLFASNVPKPGELARLLVSRPRTALAIIRFGAGGVVPASKAFRRGELEKGVRIFGDAVFGKGGFDRLPEARRQQVMDNAKNVKMEVLGAHYTPVADEAVRAMNRPVLLLTGERSVPLFHRLADRLGELLPNVVHREIEGAAHMMHEDNASSFNAEVLRFLVQH